MTAAGSTVHDPQVAQRSALRIAVIGAGPAGLATGHELLAHGFDRNSSVQAPDFSRGIADPVVWGPRSGPFLS